MKKLLYLIYLSVALLVAVSCNNSTQDTATVYYTVSTSSTLVSSFSLGGDSTYFTIDQDRRLIYNADSLPVGTDVSHMAVSMKFASTVTRAKFHVTNGKWMKDSTFYYTSATTDSVDFTGKVTLEVTSNDGEYTRAYDVKVNVHRMVPDTLYWEPSARRNLPGAAGTVTAQRMARMGVDGPFYSLLVQDGKAEVYRSSMPNSSNVEHVATVPFTPIVESFVASDDALYVLDPSHALMRSTDGVTWTDCGVAWLSIQGGYDDRVLGVMQDGAVYKHDEYPRRSNFTPSEVERGFPLSGSSPMMLADNRWSSNQQALMAGGVMADGTFSRDIWGYDGNRWGCVSIESEQWALPGLKGAVLVPYFTFTVNTNTHVATKYVTWLVMGGTLSDGSLNTKVYSSRDQGLRWSVADKSMQLPTYLPAFTGSQVFIVTRTMTASGMKAPSRISQRTTEWECPYIYLVGGRNQSGAVLNNVWVGVVNRLMFREVQ